MRRRGRGEAGNRSETKTLADTCSVPAGLLAPGRSGASRVPRRVPLAPGARERDARGRPARTRSAAGAGYVRTSPVLCQERGAGEAGARASTPAAPAPRQLEGPAPAPPRPRGPCADLICDPDRGMRQRALSCAVLRSGPRAAAHGSPAASIAGHGGASAAAGRPAACSCCPRAPAGPSWRAVPERAGGPPRVVLVTRRERV